MCNHLLASNTYTYSLRLYVKYDLVVISTKCKELFGDTGKVNLQPLISVTALLDIFQF